MPRNITAEAVENGVVLEMTRTGAFAFRNAMAAAGRDGRHDKADAFELRAAVPVPTDETESVTVELDRGAADAAYGALREAAEVSADKENYNTASRIDDRADRVAKALADESFNRYDGGEPERERESGSVETDNALERSTI